MLVEVIKGTKGPEALKPIIQEEEINKWQAAVSALKTHLTIQPTYSSIYEGTIVSAPKDFSGTVSVTEKDQKYEFFWRSWEVFSHSYIGITGKIDQTKWNMATIRLVVNDEHSDQEVLRGSNIYETNYHAIRCAVFESCQAKKEEYEQLLD